MVAGFVLGAALARKLHSLLLLRILVFGTCLFVYEPLRVLIPTPVSKLTIIGASAVVAALLCECIERFALQRRGDLWKAAVAAVSVVAVLFCSTQIGEKLVEASSQTPASAAQRSNKNVLVIVVDTLRADHLSLSGYARATSPHLDRFAAKGVVFEDAVSTSSWTLPAHVSLLTGRYPHEHHAVTQEDRLPQDIPVVSEWFAQHGYRTGAFSANPMFFSRRAGFGRGFQTFRDVYPPLSPLFVVTKAGRQLRDFLYQTHLTESPLGRISAEAINQQAMSWIDHGSQPFFLVINLLDVHDPYVPPPAYRDRFVTPSFPTGGIGVTFDEFPQLSPEQVRQQVAMYDSAISYVDDQIDLLLQQLERKGMLQNTVVVLTSDHGEELNEHGFFTHANALYRELIHVPLVIVASGEVPAGTRISTPVSLTNIPATLIDLSTGQTVPEFPRQSLAALWRDPSSRANWPPPISELAQLHICECFPNSKESFKAITSGDWQYIAGSKGDEQLFRLSSDPNNMNNLAGSPSPEVLPGLRLALASATQ